MHFWQTFKNEAFAKKHFLKALFLKNEAFIVAGYIFLVGAHILLMKTGSLSSFYIYMYVRNKNELSNVITGQFAMKICNMLFPLRIPLASFLLFIYSFSMGNDDDQLNCAVLKYKFFHYVVYVLFSCIYWYLLK